MLSVVDSALDNDDARVLAAILAAQAVYISTLGGMIVYGAVSEETVKASLTNVAQLIRKIEEERCAGSSPI